MTRRACISTSQLTDDDKQQNDYLLRQVASLFSQLFHFSVVKFCGSRLAYIEVSPHAGPR